MASLIPPSKPIKRSSRPRHEGTPTPNERTTPPWLMWLQSHHAFLQFQHLNGRSVPAHPTCGHSCQLGAYLAIYRSSFLYSGVTSAHLITHPFSSLGFTNVPHSDPLYNKLLHISCPKISTGVFYLTWQAPPMFSSKQVPSDMALAHCSMMFTTPSVSSSAVLCELTVPASCKSISFPCYSRFSDVYAIFSAQDLPISRYRGAFFISYYSLRF